MEAFPHTAEIKKTTEELDNEFERLIRKEFAKAQNRQVKARRADKKKRRVARKQSRK